MTKSYTMALTKNPVKDRIAESYWSLKDFTEFRYVQVKDRIASRNLEGSALHNADGKGASECT